ncbi:hypothetical protein CEUSTIGMA_g12671.t1 [Chlamydomonas eustigma]|uniref:Uncharacterized protein n=1 Tax=Chlamydomonas eustigma TaxID=1157962 RepID=A0A250XQ98_9CHLO|nr:hypothetical protein CEUSTIGMA_g12671.t1 [Chlamydomonas eustigma]|eukprot:GAX85251.1 hypothetical protein CEUSTIGMA_g12671.t1 [Chlamydomonas eustigma]
MHKCNTDVLLSCGNQNLDRQLSSSAVEETRQAMFTQVNDFKKRQEHASSSAAQLPLIHHLQQQTEGMQGTSSMRHNHMITKALHTIIGQNHNTTSQVHTLTLLMNDLLEEMNRRAQQDLHVNKTEHEITRQQVNRLVVAKDWYAQQPGALDSQSTVQRLSQAVQPLKGTNAKSIGRLGNARKRQIFMSSQSLILSDEEAQALQAVAQKEHNALEALQLGRCEADATAAAMQCRGSAAGPAAGVATTTMPLETTLCMTVKDKRSATVATSVTVTVPFVVPSFWVIPSRRVDQYSTGLSQMMHWPQDKKWEDLNIYDVLQWWDEGMTMLIEDTTVVGCKREVHLAAFRLLEHPLLRHKWKYQGGGNTISKPMIMVKNVVYGVHKRVKGLPRKEGDTMHEKLSREDAVQDLNLVLQNYSKSLKSNIRNKPTLYKLAESLITGNKEGCLKEFTPEEYEKKVLKNDMSIFTEPSSSWK